MNALTVKEMRSVDGGYAVQCTYCGKVARYLGPIGVTMFKLNHKHLGRGKTIWYGGSGSSFWA